MISIYTAIDQGQDWLRRYARIQPHFACVLGFTETALIPGISAAGKEPNDRKFTAHADAEFLINGICETVKFPLPPLTAGVSPTVISRSVIQNLAIPTFLINAGLPEPLPESLSVPAQVLSDRIARCVSSGAALPIETVKQLFAQGLAIGEQWSKQHPGQYLLIGECVVGGTTTALAVLLGLGIDATGKVNSSHPTCNHAQKLALVTAGLNAINFRSPQDPDYGFHLLAAVGDPMQPVAAGMAIGASLNSGVLLAGGTQMLAVYAIAHRLAQAQSIAWEPKNIVIGTTRWVAEDPTGDTIGLVQALEQKFGPVVLLASQLNFAKSKYLQLQRYEQGFVKEGVGAGGCAIAATLCQGWSNARLVEAIEALVGQI